MVADFLQDNYKIIIGICIFIFFIVCSQKLAHEDTKTEPPDSNPTKWFWRKVFLHVKNFFFFITLMYFGICFGLWCSGRLFVFLGECMFAPAQFLFHLIHG